MCRRWLNKPSLKVKLTHRHWLANQCESAFGLQKFSSRKKSDLQFSDGLPHRSYSSLARKRPIPIESRMCSEGRFESFCLILPESFWPRKFQGSKRKVASISTSASKLVSLVSGPIDYVGQGKRSRNQAATAKTTEILAYISLQLCQYFVRKY